MERAVLKKINNTQRNNLKKYLYKKNENLWISHNCVT